MVTLRNNSHEIKKVLALVFKRVRNNFPKPSSCNPGPDGCKPRPDWTRQVQGLLVWGFWVKGFQV